jgi:hypothetical protein
MLALAASATALAMPAATAAPLVEGLAGPLQIDVSGDSVFVTQAFSGTVTEIGADGSRHDLVQEPGEVAGLAAADDGSVVYNFTGGDENGPIAQLKRIMPGGEPEVLADLWEHERTTNPDARKTYGFTDISDECGPQLPPFLPGVNGRYKGILESHPYAVAEAPGGGWYVADAAANAVLKVAPDGDVSTVYVSRPQPLTVTAEIAAGLGLPECTVGHAYKFESVPTDVEVTRSGRLYISLLPGGPEGPELGARGKVVRFNPENGEDKTILRNLAGGTNVALAPNRRIFATETFGGQVIKANRRTGEVLRTYQMKLPSAVEYEAGKLYVTKTVFGNGRLVVLHP